MLKFDTETKIMSIIAKDTGSFILTLDNYILDKGDKVYFTVNNELEQKNPKIQKVIDKFENGKAIIQLTSDDTNIDVGTYYYDVEVDTADGRVDTIMGPISLRFQEGLNFD